MRMEHIAFNVQEPARFAAWYAANLGMKIARAFEEPPHIHFLADSAGKSMIEIYGSAEAADIDYAAHHATTFHLAFAVEDMDVERARLLEAGATLDGEIDHRPNGDKLAFLRDPWGHAIQLVQRRQKMLE